MNLLNYAIDCLIMAELKTLSVIIFFKRGFITLITVPTQQFNKPNFASKTNVKLP